MLLYIYTQRHVLHDSQLPWVGQLLVLGQTWVSILEEVPSQEQRQEGGPKGEPLEASYLGEQGFKQLAHGHTHACTDEHTHTHTPHSLECTVCCTHRES